jgi:hypothetical protein
MVLLDFTRALLLIGAYESDWYADGGSVVVSVKFCDCVDVWLIFSPQPLQNLALGNNALPHFLHEGAEGFAICGALQKRQNLVLSASSLPQLLQFIIMMLSFLTVCYVQ